jgi:hypothetical protein
MLIVFIGETRGLIQSHDFAAAADAVFPLFLNDGG